MEINAKGNKNFAIKVISTENVEGKSSHLRSKNQTFFPPIFQVITLGYKFKSYLF